MINNILLLLILWLFPKNIYAESQGLNLAVLNLDVKTGMPEAEADLISDKLRFYIFQIIHSRQHISVEEKNRYTNLIERKEMEKVFEEQKFMAECGSQECAIEAGQLLQVDRIAYGQIGKIGNTYSISVLIIDVSTGKNTSLASIEYKGAIEDILGSTLKEIADILLHMEYNWENKELISIEGSPEAAIVQVDNKRFGNTPINNKLIEKGIHTINIRKSGYIDFMTQLDVELNNPVELSYDLLPISKWYLTKKSLLLPGSGQRNSGHSVKGNIFTALETIAVAGVIGSTVIYYDVKAKYDDAYKKYQASGYDEILFKKAEQQYDDVDVSSKVFKVAFSAAVGIYLLNIADVILSPSENNYTQLNRQIHFHSMMNNGVSGISISMRF